MLGLRHGRHTALVHSECNDEWPAFQNICPRNDSIGLPMASLTGSLSLTRFGCLFVSKKTPNNAEYHKRQISSLGQSLDSEKAADPVTSALLDVFLDTSSESYGT